MKFSYIGHPVIANQMVPLIRTAYAELGIETEFYVQPSARNLLSVVQGNADGEVAYSEDLLGPYPELIMVDPPLLTSVFVLLCQRELPCSEDVFAVSRESVVMTEASQDGLIRRYGETLKARPYIINELNRIPSLITEKRFRYGVYVMSEQQLQSFKRTEMKVHPIFRSRVFHILHKKHQHIAPAVGEVLARLLTKQKPPQ